MNIEQIEKNLTALVKNISEETFIYDLLLAYGVPKATVSLLKKGKRNLSKRDDQIIPMYSKQIIKGAANNKPSIRSKRPPCPGIILPISFTP